MTANPSNPAPDPDDSSNEWRVDRTAFSVASSFEEAEEQDRIYWFSKTPHERLHAAEMMRRQVYGEERATARLVRVLTIVGLDGL